MASTPREDLYTRSVVHPNSFVHEKVEPPKLNQKFIGESSHKQVVTSTYGVDLSGTKSDDEPTMAAKYTASGSERRYYIRFHAGKPMDPYGLSFKLDDFMGQKEVRGKLRYEFREVESDAYFAYVKFLESRASSYLKEVERLIDG